MKPFSPLLFAALLAVPAPGTAGELRYGAALHESAWEVSSSRQKCRLSQQIPHYGTAAFVQEAGRDLYFVLSIKRPVSGEAEGAIYTVPPQWIHGVLPRALSPVRFTGGGEALVLPVPVTQQLLDALEQGFFPMLSYRDRPHAVDDVSVAVSAVNVRKSLDAFYSCLGRLLPYGFEDVRLSTLHFAAAGSELDKAARKRLDQLAVYLAADAAPRITVKGHTDRIGSRRYNRALSERRAKAVKTYLMEKGVAGTRIALEILGATQPAGDNRNEAGRAKNRRVEVVLSR